MKIQIEIEVPDSVVEELKQSPAKRYSIYTNYNGNPEIEYYNEEDIKKGTSVSLKEYDKNMFLGSTLVFKQVVEQIKLSKSQI